MTATPTVALACTFTQDLIAETTAWWLARVRPEARVTTAPYGQLLEALHDPAGALRPDAGLNVIVLRPEDLLRQGDDASLVCSRRADALVTEITAALTRAAATGTARWLLGIPPPSPRLARHSEALAWVERVTGRIVAAARDASIRSLDLTEMVDCYHVDAIHDEYGDVHAHLPYTDDYLAALGTWIARSAEAAWARPRKLIVLDCDNTLWSGVCGEDGPDGVVVTDDHRYLQRFMRRQRTAGRLLALCSRNEVADVRAVFARDDMELPLTEITSHRIGWLGKPAAIRELADELGFALDAVIFVDDDPIECGAVEQTLPDVAVVQVPTDAGAIPDQLRHTWVFDQFTVTDDDRLRPARYAEEQHRRDAREASTDYADFLRRCATVVEFLPLTASSDVAVLDRAAQLTSRTTQFTLTGEVFSVPDLRAFLRTGAGWTVVVRDRFGDYGTVGLLLAEREDRPVVAVRLLLMSCRVLNRGVERQFVRHLLHHATETGARAIELPYRYTTRNTPARLFLAGLAAEPLEPPDGRVSMAIGASALIEQA
ncbi:HAD-IIIC family phosphatase [Mangrovihabitans endophyticus]|uniref:HAD-superfamily phosphatase, subfamily IIIC/FkbH-like domain-containing protein n=1 Tax=Mangrovihabitans endophyticus TaxID=1751298 RepID=A0A8J3BS67_9ACTN|nr:HAD-IIIC family phosphatase [Mangrovihabitans endophyticus]GGK72675.1 hypothetical protein GCM10012284_03140 [Mangrovihabitans endophyticus]